MKKTNKVIAVFINYTNGRLNSALSIEKWFVEEIKISPWTWYFQYAEGRGYPYNWIWTLTRDVSCFLFRDTNSATRYQTSSPHLLWMNSSIFKDSCFLIQYHMINSYSLPRSSTNFRYLISMDKSFCALSLGNYFPKISIQWSQSPFNYHWFFCPRLPEVFIPVKQQFTSVVLVCY